MEVSLLPPFNGKLGKVGNGPLRCTECDKFALCAPKAVSPTVELGDAFSHHVYVEGGGRSAHSAHLVSSLFVLIILPVWHLLIVKVLRDNILDAVNVVTLCLPGGCEAFWALGSFASHGFFGIFLSHSSPGSLMR